MPEEFDAGAGSDTGMDQGDGGALEAAGESSQEPAGETAQQPSYMTREAFEEAMAGFSTAQQERIDKALSGFTGMQDMIRQLVESQKPKPPPLIPDEKDLANIDARGMRDLLHRMAEEHKGSIESLRKQLTETQENWRRQSEASRIHGYLSEQIGKASEQYKLLQKPLGKQLMQAWVISALQNNGNDYRKINVPQMGAQLNALLESEIKERMSSAASKAAPAAGTQRGPDGKFVPAKAPPKGTGAKPAVGNAAEGVTLKNFSAKAREMIARELGGGRG